MTNVYLYGHLGRRFGHRWRLEVSSPAEAVRGIMANRPEFRRYLTQHSTPGYQVFIGPDPIADAQGLAYPVGRQAIKIVPVIAGAAKSPVIGIIIGAVIIIASIVTFQYYGIAPGVGAAAGTLTTTGSLAISAGFIGAGLVIGGVSTLLAGQDKASTKEAAENTPSALFNGPVNTTVQGHPVPVGYGLLRVGSAVISAGILTEDVPVA